MWEIWINGCYEAQDKGDELSSSVVLVESHESIAEVAAEEGEGDEDSVGGGGGGDGEDWLNRCHESWYHSGASSMHIP